MTVIMTSGKFIVAVAAALMALPSETATAAGCVGDHSCSYYANTAIRQHRINRELGCGYRGERWHDNHFVHKTWCDFNCDKSADHIGWRADRLSRCWAAQNRRSGYHRFYWPRIGPRIGGGTAAFLAWCRFPARGSRGTECGRPAAQQFCERHSYSVVAEMQRRPNIDQLFGPIRYIGNWNLLQVGNSHGFTFITCAGQILH